MSASERDVAGGAGTGDVGTRAGLVTTPPASTQASREEGPVLVGRDGSRAAWLRVFRSPGPWRRWAGPGLFTAACLVGFVCYLRMSSTVATNSDGASNALQAWDMLHGNLLLHGWWLSDVSFYTTELPEYMLVEVVHGLNADVVHLGAALTYTLLIALAALLAKGRATGTQGWVRMLIAAGLLLAPQLGVGTQVLLLSPDHVGTAVPVLVAWLLLDRFGRRWWVPAAVGLLLAWALVADVIVLYIGIAPLLAVSLVRAYQEIVPRRLPGGTTRQNPPQSQPGGTTPRNQSQSPPGGTNLRNPPQSPPGGMTPQSPPRWRRPSQAWYELSLAGAALVALVVGLKVPSLIHSLGGYSVVPAPQRLAPISEMITRMRLTGAGLLLLFGGDFLGLRFGLKTGLVLLHLVGVAVAGWAVCAAARRFLRGSDLVVQLLVAGTLIIVAAYLFARQVPGIGYSHEMAPALPFAAVLAGRLLAGRLISVRVVPVAAAVLLGYLVTLGSNALAQPAPPVDPRLASFLAGHHLRYGLSGYWQADAITLASGNQIQVRALQVNRASVSASHWESDASWYDPRLHDAHFVLLFSGQPGFSGQAGLQPFDPASQVWATFGPPAQTYNLGRYTVLVWHQNLLRRL
jgi:hypothetical protein